MKDDGKKKPIVQISEEDKKKDEEEKPVSVFVITDYSGARKDYETCG